MSDVEAADVEQRIDAQFESLSPELQRAARWLRLHGPTIAVNSMRQSAQAAGVAPVTMVRLARRLGYADFDGLRAPFARRLIGAPPAAARKSRPGSLPAALASLRDAQLAHVGAGAVQNAPSVIEAAARTLLQAQRVGFLGQRISHGVAFQLQYGYALLAPNGLLLTDAGGTLGDQLSTLTAGCVLVTVSQSPYTRSVVDATARVREQGASVVALTDSPLSPIARGAAHALIYGAGAPGLLHSTCGALALVEALLAAVAHVGGDAARAHWAARQRQLARDRAYWETPKDHR